MDSIKTISEDIADILKGHWFIHDTCGDRVLSEDYRVSGWNTAPVTVTDQDGLFMPTIVVDDQGEQEDFFFFGAPPNASRTAFFVWIFSSRGRDSGRNLESLTMAVRQTLHGASLPKVKGNVLFSGRIGRVIADDGQYDRLTFSIGSIINNDVFIPE